MLSRSHAPLVEVAFAEERQSDPRAIGRRRRHDRERVAEHAVGGGGLLELINGEQRVGEGGHAVHIA
eukprot:6185112-Pleurochrysis_carterae.AAC.3